MKIFSKINELRAYLKSVQGNIGFVPTMGFLHNGHISLVEKSVSENEHTVCSIFVNPTQFGQNEDLDTYPVNIEKDLELLEKAGCDSVFIPPVDEIYNDHKVFIYINNLSEKLCGEKRPGHFEGVLTVVAKLFNIVSPDNAYFGEKDYQQLLIIKKMVYDLNYTVNVVGCPIVREYDGLAMSSRNSYLSEKEREKALFLKNLIDHVKKIAVDGMAVAELENIIYEYVKENMDKDFLNVDYIELRSSINLEKEEIINKDTRIFLAVFCGKTRLIDNSSIF